MPNRSHVRGIVALAFLLGLSGWAGLGAGQVVEVPDDLGAISCAPEQVQAWTDLRAHSLGVSAEDPTRGRIGGTGASKNVGTTLAEELAFRFFAPGAFVGDWFRHTNWVPVTGDRETFCGRVSRYYRYDGGYDERDWTFFLHPRGGGDPSSALLDAAGWACGPENFCCANNNCLEAEITPPGPLLGDELFPPGVEAPGIPSPFLCVNGPFVRETLHEFKPEIHPAQLLWWRENCGETGECADEDLSLLIVQDASHRFDESHHFVPGNRPDGWEPWSAAPVGGRFRIAVAFPARVSVPAWWFLITRDSRNLQVVPQDEKLEVRRHGSTLARLSNVGDSARSRFVDYCADRGRILGYLELEATVGAPGRGNEGYHFMKLITGVEAVRVPIDISLIASRLQLRGNRGAQTYVGSVLVSGSGESSPRRLFISTPAGKVQEIPVESSNGGDWRVELAGIELGAGVSIADESGRAEAELAGANLSGRLRAGTRREGAASAALAREVAEMLKVDSAFVARHLKVSKAWVGAVIPEYVPSARGRLQPEDDGVIAAELNAAVLDWLDGGPGERAKGLFGDQVPFTVRWRLEQGALGAPGADRKPARGSIKALRREQRLADTVVEIEVGNPSPRDQVFLVAEISDLTGARLELSEELPPAYFVLGEGRLEELVTGLSADVRDDAKRRHGLALAKALAEDGRITIAECLAVRNAML